MATRLMLETLIWFEMHCMMLSMVKALSIWIFIRRRTQNVASLALMRVLRSFDG
ncbi:hypothetical protein HAX54_014635, partial [Datura stramonium]|nr:hypothetical protein [Datura stramonium]